MTPEREYLNYLLRAHHSSELPSTPGGTASEVVVRSYCALELTVMKRAGRTLFILCLSGMLFYSSRSVSSQQRPTASADGAALYRQKCAVCHDNASDRTPPRSVIAQLPPQQVIESMTTGVMKPQATGLSSAEIQAIAVYLTGKQPAAATQAKEGVNVCRSDGGPINLSGPQWNGWGRDLDNSHYQPDPGLKAEDVPKLKLKWAFGYPGAGRGGNRRSWATASTLRVRQGWSIA